MNLVIKTLNVFVIFICFFQSSKASIIINNEQSLQHQFSKENEIYVLSSACDLKGSVLRLPNKSILQFKGGMLLNGEIIGTNSCIQAPTIQIFQNIKITGLWNNKKVYSEWMAFKEGPEHDNKYLFRNLMALCKGDTQTEVYIQSGCYWTSVNEYSCAFNIPSNTAVHCRATICELPNHFKNTCLVAIHKSTNVLLEGGIFIGDLKTHIGDEGEWSHGIEIRGSSNVTIKNVRCSYFFGDGIDILEGFNKEKEPVFGCKNITILQSASLYNRRQGLSIEAVENCLVKDCEFSYTGRYKSTPPSAGIDIEAWSSNSEKIKNIRIVNCKMLNNVGSSFQSYANAVFGKKYNCYKNSIKLIDCLMEDVAISHTNDIEFLGCTLDRIKYQKSSLSVKFIRCKIKQQYAR